MARLLTETTSALTVTYDEAISSWRLRWNGLEMRVIAFRGIVQSLYFGPECESIPENDGQPWLCSLSQGRSEVTVSVGRGDDLVLWESWEWAQEGNTLTIKLLAEGYPLQASLSYEVDPATGVLTRRNELLNTSESQVIPLREVTSFAARLPLGVYEMILLPGTYMGEAQVERLPITGATTRIESRNGKTGFEYVPYIGITSEDFSYAFELCWSGNWQMSARKVQNVGIDIGGGLNSYGFAHDLQPGELLELPEAILACVKGDLNKLTHALHDRLRVRRPDPDRFIPTQFNSWMASDGQPTLERMKPLIATAAELGLEVFMLDAGWYTTEVENAKPEPSAEHNSWDTQKGDWVADRWLYPNGLSEMSDYCRSLGLGFGVWFELDTVGQGSVIAREHPEWLHKPAGILKRRFPPRIVNLGVPEAREFIRERVFRILNETSASWMKWDFNTEIAQGGWHDGAPSHLKSIDPMVSHYRGIYQLLDEIRESYPDLTIEMCAGGGGRFDQAIMKHAHTNLMSDQGTAVPLLSIHMGQQLAHLPIQMNGFVADWPVDENSFGAEADLAFRLRVSMMGSLCISCRFDKWSEDDLRVAGREIAAYKSRIRPLIHDADQYLLTPPPAFDGGGDWAAVWYASKDACQGVLFAFRMKDGALTREFSLPGLDPDARYTLRGDGASHEVRTGAQLADGIQVAADSPLRSVVVYVDAVI